MGFRKLACIIAIAAAVLCAAQASYAVSTPASGTVTPNGKFAFVPDQSNNLLKIVDVSKEVQVGAAVGLGGQPWSMAVNSLGTELFVVVDDTVKAYQINTSTGALTPQATSAAVGGLYSLLQCAISPDNKYLFVTYGPNIVEVFDVSNPAVSIPKLGSFTVSGAVDIFGIAIKPDGTRLYVTDKHTQLSPPNDNLGNLYIYDITASKIAPTLIKSITGIPAASYVAVNTDGDRLFVRVLQKTGAHNDVLVYNISTREVIPLTAAYKVNNLPGNHLDAGSDIDTNNAFDGLSLSPNGWFMFFSHYNGFSNNGMSYYRDTLYGVSVASLDAGFQTNSNSIWTLYGGPSSGYHSTDGLIASRLNKVLYTYSDGASFESVPTTADANIAPTAPQITYPLTGNPNVAGAITWNDSEDNGPVTNLTYTIQMVHQSTLEYGTSSWETVASMVSNAPNSCPFFGFKHDQSYYIRIRAYDGTYNGPWSYSGPFTMSPTFVEPPTTPSWTDHYRIASNEVTVDWAVSPLAVSYDVQYHVAGTTWTGAPVVNVTAPYYSTSDPNPNAHLAGLTAQTTYEVRVRAVGTGGTSLWAKSHTFYTLETPWLDYFNIMVSTNEMSTSTVEVLWGPIVSLNTPFIPLADHFEIKLRKLGDASWTSLPNTTNATWEDIDVSNLNFKLGGLTANTTYELIMRTVDNHGLSDSGVSTDAVTLDKYWSSVATFETNPARIPWIDAYEISSTWAHVQWGARDGSKNIPGVIKYELQYKLPSDTLWTSYNKLLGPTTQEVPGNTNLCITFEGNAPPTPPTLTAFTTYEVRIRGRYPDGTTTLWSNVDTFYTMEGPNWSSAYNVTAESAVINCENVPLITQYQFAYRKVTDPKSAWTTTVFLTDPHDNPGDTNPNILLSAPFLVPSTTYEVKARCTDGTHISDWSSASRFYTLERPWVDWYADSNASHVYITWGPEFSAGPNIPGAVGYNWEWRVNGGNWTISSEVLLPGRKDDSTSVNYNFVLPAFVLVPNATIEVKMRAIDATGGVSMWSGTSVPGGGASQKGAVIVISPIGPGDPVVYVPWINTYGATTKEAVVLWNWVAGNPVVSKYEMSSSTDEGKSWQIYSGSWAPLTPATKYDATSVNPNFLFDNLTSLKTYEVKIRALDGSNNQVGNPSAVHIFHTFYQPWLSHFHVASNEAGMQYGPVIATGLGSFEMQYKKATDTVWTNYSGPTFPLPLGNTNWWEPTYPAPNVLIGDPPVSPLSPNTTYEVRARAVHISNFASDWSKTDSFITVRGPWWIDVKDIDNNRATLFWEKNITANNFELKVSTDPTAEGGTIIPLIAGTTSETSVALTANTTYYAKVRAITASGPSDWTSVVSFYTMRAPKWISNFSTSMTTTHLTWEGVSGLDNYQVTYGISPDVSANSITYPGTQSFTTSPSIEGLTPRTWYRARVRGIKGVINTTWSSTLEFYTFSAPSWADVTATTNNSISITWEALNIPAWTPSYEVSWGVTPDASGSGDAVTSNPYYTMTPLTTGKEYYIKIRARDGANGWSEWAPYPYLTAIATDQAISNGMDAGSGIKSALRGATVVITGSNFGTIPGWISFESGGTYITAQPGSWTSNKISVSIPPKAISGANHIHITTFDGKVVAFIGAGGDAFTVLDGGFVIDDFEGGAYQYATWEAGGGNSMTLTKIFTGAPERTTYQTASIAGNAGYEYVGGVSTYGDLPSEEGYDISGNKVIKFKIRNDSGTTLVATFELIESNMAPFNDPSISLGAEMYVYNIPIVVNPGPSFQDVTIRLTDEASASKKFVRDATWYDGNHKLDLNKIKSYQILTKGNNPKSYSIDYIAASTFEVSVPYNLYFSPTLGNKNYISLAAEGAASTMQGLGDIIASAWPTPQDGDRISISKWDSNTQSEVAAVTGDYYSGWYWDPPTPISISVGDAFEVRIVNSAGTPLSFTMNLLGLTPSLTPQYPIFSNTLIGNKNYVSLPLTRSDLISAQAIGDAVVTSWSGISDGDRISVAKWNGQYQSENGMVSSGDYYSGWGVLWDPITPINVIPGEVVEVRVIKSDLSSVSFTTNF